MQYIAQSKLAQWRKENTPDVCPILGCPMIDPVVDHCHRTGLIRGVISREANSLVGRVENYFYRYCESKCTCPPEQAVRNVAEYLQSYWTDILHPVGAKQLMSRFKRKTKSEQEKILQDLKAKKSKINACANTAERCKIYESLIKTNNI